MRPAIESRGELNVRVKNSYNISAQRNPAPFSCFPFADAGFDDDALGTGGGLRRA